MLHHPAELTRSAVDLPGTASEPRISMYAAGIFLLVALYASNAYGYFNTLFPVAKALYLYLATVALAVSAILLRRNEVFRDYPLAFIAWLGIYLCQILITYLYSSQTVEADEQLIAGIRTIAVLFALSVLIHRVDPKVVMMAVVLVTVTSVVLNIYDFLIPTFSKTVGRAAGFYENPNASGKMLAINMTLGCMLLPRKYRLLFCAFASIGILFTFSRSAWLLWAIAVIGLAATGQLFLRSRLSSMVMIGTLGILVIYALLTGVVLDVLYALGLESYLSDNVAARLGGLGSTFQDASTDVRLDMVRHSIAEFREHPWLGAGLGATSEWMTLDRPHNLYLMIAVESGVVGLLVLCGLLWIMWAKSSPAGRVAALLFAVSSLFAHTSLSQAYMLCTIAIIVVTMSSSNGRSQSHLSRNFA